MADQDEPYIASLIRKGETEPYAFEVLKAKSWNEAEGLANEWALVTIAADGGLSEATWLHLKQGAVGKFVRDWSSP